MVHFYVLAFCFVLLLFFVVVFVVVVFILFFYCFVLLSLFNLIDVKDTRLYCLFLPLRDII